MGSATQGTPVAIAPQLKPHRDYGCEAIGHHGCEAIGIEDAPGATFQAMPKSPETVPIMNLFKVSHYKFLDPGYDPIMMLTTNT